MGSLRGEAPHKLQFGRGLGGKGGSLPPPNIRHAAHMPSFVKIDQNLLEYVLRHPKINILRTWTSTNHQNSLIFELLDVGEMQPGAK